MAQIRKKFILIQLQLLDFIMRFSAYIIEKICGLVSIYY